MFSLSSRSHPRAEAGEPPRHRGDQRYKHRQLVTEGGERKVETHVEWVGALSGIREERMNGVLCGVWALSV